MRKILIGILLMVQIIFLIPILFTQTFETRVVNSRAKEENKKEEEKKEIDTSAYDYKQYNTIQLLHQSTGAVEKVNLDEYICHVVSAEMPADFEMEALKAQGVVARTYTIYKITTNQKKHENADICDSASCCQAWISKEDRLAKWDETVRQSNWKKIEEAVYATKGKMITYEGKPINAFFHSNSGGKTEIPFNVWGGSGYPYLQSVETAGEEQYSQYHSEVTLSKEEFVNKIKEKHSDLEIDFSKENEIEIKEKTQSGRVKTLKVGNLELAGVEIRTILGLRSTDFTFTIENDQIKFSVVGYGHGVGMSQTGADAMAKQEKDYEEIIKHFYTGVEITNL